MSDKAADRPTLNENASSVMIGGTFIPWDADNARPLDYQCEAGRIYGRALEAAGMTEPDPYVAGSAGSNQAAP